MPGWRRNQRSGTPAAALAGPPPARPRDDWRALPPLPTVLRSPITTVAVGAFSEGLSTWRDPSFLAPLSHQIDPGGPSGLIAGLASTPASPEPTTYYHDHPLPLAGRRPPASLQRSAAHSGPSALTTAPDVDLGSLSRPAIPADPASATTQEPPGVAAEPPAPSAENLAPAAVGPVQPPEAPLVSHRDPGPVTAQRQMAPPSPQAPPPNRRLGLGAPLNSPPGGPSAPATLVSLPPVVARSAGPPPADTGGRTPRPPVLPDPGNPAAGPPEHALIPEVFVQPAPADPAHPPGLEPPAPAPAGGAPSADAPMADAPPAGTPAMDELPGGAPADEALPEAAPPEPPPATAPLLGVLPPTTLAVGPPIFRPPAATPPPGTSSPGQMSPPPLSAARPAVQRSVVPVPASPAAARPAAQRSAICAQASPSANDPALQRSGPLTQAPPSGTRPAVRRSAPQAQPSRGDQQVHSPAPQPSALPGPSPAFVTHDPGPAGVPATLLAVAQRLSVGSALPPRAELAPLLGRRPPPRVLDTLPGPPPAPVSVIPDAPQATPVQRSARALASVSRTVGPAGIVPSGPASGHPGPAAGYGDPGSIAVARGLARREPDGSVVFDLGPAPAPPDPAPPPYPLETVQRQDAPADTPAPGEAPALSPGSAASTATRPGPAEAAGHPAAPGPASPPLDELARQLFGPLSARLKAELRLDRERAGLLTDLRQ